MPVSGPNWVIRFPTSASTVDLVEPFRTSVDRFIAALRAAHAAVIIGDTLRPPERAYLMHFAFQIARNGMDPAAVPAMPGVEIQWVHTSAAGQPDAAASRAAAQAMVSGYGIVHQPALQSRHTQGLAIDMNVAWHGNLTIVRADGTAATVTSVPRDGAGNVDLHAVGTGYGLIKLVSDPPHWSSDGH